MELDEVRAFVAVTDVGSVSGAARELHLTQSAVTRQLQRLESSLGTTLLDRYRKPFALTEAGQAVLGKCRLLLRSMQDVYSATAVDGSPSGELRIGVAHALNQVTLTEPVEQLSLSFPKVSLRLSTGWSRDLLECVRSGSLDAAVILLPESEPLPGDVRGERLGSDQLLLIAPRRGRTSRIRRITELAGVNWVLNPGGCGARAGLQRALFRANVNMRVAVETYNYDLQLSLVARGRGLSLVPARILRRSRLRSRLRVVRIRGLEFPLAIWTVRAHSATKLNGVLDGLSRDLTRRLSSTHRRTHSGTATRTEPLKGDAR